MVWLILLAAVAAIAVYGIWYRRSNREVITSPAPVVSLPVQGVGTYETFFVATEDGDVRYEGNSGGDARRAIEALRAEGITWGSARNGVKWDWGPRG